MHPEAVQARARGHGACCDSLPGGGGGCSQEHLPLRIWGQGRGGLGQRAARACVGRQELGCWGCHGARLVGTCCDAGPVRTGQRERGGGCSAEWARRGCWAYAVLPAVLGSEGGGWWAGWGKGGGGLFKEGKGYGPRRRNGFLFTIKGVLELFERGFERYR